MKRSVTPSLENRDAANGLFTRLTFACQRSLHTAPHHNNAACVQGRPHRLCDTRLLSITFCSAACHSHFLFLRFLRLTPVLWSLPLDPNGSPAACGLCYVGTVGCRSTSRSCWRDVLVPCGTRAHTKAHKQASTPKRYTDDETCKIGGELKVRVTAWLSPGRAKPSQPLQCCTNDLQVSCGASVGQS